MTGAIGVFDSGLGGLTVLKELQDALRNESFVYLGDTARTPYGTKGAATIIRYARECFRFLRAHEVKAVVVACNTVSSHALEILAAESPVPVIGTVDPAVRVALSSTRNGTIAVLGTHATINSGAYEGRLRRDNPGLRVVSKACPLFVPLVENGLWDGGIVEQTIDMYLREVRDSGVDTVVLGCTHYPLLVESLSKYFGPEVRLVESSKAIAQVLAELLEPSQAKGERVGSTRYFVTDDVSRFDALANTFLAGRDVKAVKVESLA